MRTGALALALIIALAARTAVADDDEALAAMRRGVAAFGRGDAEQALREYDAAKRAAPLANMPFRYAAEALLSIKRYHEAVESLEAYLAKRPDVADASDVRMQIARIRAEHFPARARIATNVVGARAEVLVDGVSHGTSEALETTAGRHHIEVRAARHEPASQSVTLIGDQDAALAFTLREAPVPERPPVAARSSDAGGMVRTVGFVGVGVGVVTFVTALIIDVGVVGPKISDYHHAADLGDPAARGLRDDAKTMQTAAVVCYVVGSLLMLGGAFTVLMTPPPRRAAALRVLPQLAGTQAGIALGSAF